MARNVALTGCLGILATMVACSDDTATPVGPIDGSTANDAAVADSAKADSSSSADAPPSTDVAAQDSVAPVEGSTADSNAAETAAPDTGVGDGGVVDTGVADTNVADTGVADTSVADSSVGDTSVADAAVADTSPEDTSVRDSAGSDGASQVDAEPVDAAPTDGAVQPPPPLNMCSLMDSFWYGDRENLLPAWVLWIAQGPSNPDAAGYSYAGFVNEAPFDCAIGNIINTAWDPTNGFQNWDAYTADVNNFVQAFFGCPVDSGTPARPFALVPSENVAPLTTADLQRIGAWFVEAINWAVTNQALNNPEAILSADQTAQIEAEIAYQETLYPHILDSNAYSQSTCPADAGSGD
ncbi:MAG: hypothetical protein ABTD50_00455 [Polyangiaceae bacterium]